VKTTPKILLIDDEPEFVTVLTQRLAKRNYPVRSALSGRLGLAELKQDQEIEVVLLDLKMPDLDGIETLKRIKSKWPLIEVIMLTGHGAIESAVEAIKRGAFDFVSKPVEIDHLIAKIETAAARKRHRDKLILDVYMTPYLTRREQDEKVRAILEGKPGAD
jgi:DNA-binding NtrC family response regulator